VAALVSRAGDDPFHQGAEIVVAGDELLGQVFSAPPFSSLPSRCASDCVTAVEL
jgi:hypothetical protein